MGMFVVNYLICTICSYYYMGDVKLFESAPGIGFTVFLGILSGILYLGSFMLLQWNIRANGVVLSATFMKLGVLVPTLMAIVIFHEKPEVMQIIGFALAIFAIILINFEKEAMQEGNHKLYLLILLLGGGITDSMANIYDKMGSTLLKDHYLIFTFFMAAVLSLVLTIRSRKKIHFYDILFGVIIGVPNYYSARFLLLALGSVPAVITYPVYSISTIALIAAAGVLLFREKISKQKAVSLGIIMVSLVCLNL